MLQWTPINWKRRAGTLRSCCRRALVEREFEWPFGIGLSSASSDAQLDLVLRYELRAYVGLFTQLEFRWWGDAQCIKVMSNAALRFFLAEVGL